MTTDKTPDQTNWITLHEAFNRVGRAIFGKSWRERCARLSPARVWDEVEYPRLVVPVWDDPERKADHEGLARKGVIQIASVSDVDCFDKATAALYDALWHGEIKSIGAREDGTKEPVPEQAWFDKTGKFQISIGDSEVVLKSNEADCTWRVQIDSVSLDSLAKRLDDTRRREAEDGTVKVEFHSAAPDGIAQTAKLPPKRPVGRPGLDWDALLTQLSQMDMSQIKIGKSGWRGAVCRELLDWYVDKFQLKRAPDVATLRDKLRPELDKIEEQYAQKDTR